jgi:hypothetical protein
MSAIICSEHCKVFHVGSEPGFSFPCILTHAHGRVFLQVKNVETSVNSTLHKVKNIKSARSNDSLLFVFAVELVATPLNKIN